MVRLRLDLIADDLEVLLRSPDAVARSEVRGQRAQPARTLKGGERQEVLLVLIIPGFWISKTS